MRCCHQLPGQHLFQFVDDAGQRRPIDSDQVNAYLRENMGEAFTAKDFRTWAGTVIVASTLARREGRVGQSHVVAAVRAAAECLGNTPAICRKSYVHDTVIAAFEEGVLVQFSETLKRCRSPASRAQVLAKIIAAAAPI